MPNLYRRKAYLYKGYQSLGFSDWAPAFGGAITGVEKRGAAFCLRLMSTTWHTYNEGKRVAIFLGKGNATGLGSVTTSTDVLSEEFTAIPVDLTDAPEAADLMDANFTYLLDIAGELTAITGAS